MTTKAQTYNRAIAEALGYYVYHYDKDRLERCYYMLSIPGDCHWAGHEQDRFKSEWGGWHAGERRTEAEAWLDSPDYYTDLKAAIAASGELLEGWDIIHRRVRGVPYHALHFRWYKDGLQQVEVDSFDVLPAAICEAILQARGLVVEQWESEGE